MSMSSPTTKGNLIVIAAPSGAGKTSLVKALIENDENLIVSVSHTTRPKRPGEVHGQNYFFVDEAEFVAMIKDDAFVEHAEVFGNYYGTTKAWVVKTLDEGKDVILEIDWQGAEQVGKIFKELCSIFILPPSLESLRERLVSRGEDSDAVIENRMALAKSEMAHFPEFEYVVFNDDFDRAVSDIKAIICAQRLTTSYQQRAQHQRLQKLA